MDYNQGTSAISASPMNRGRAPQHGYNGNAISRETGLEGSFQQMKLQNCVYFLRGTCAYGEKCRFNHSMTDKMQSANYSIEELPERPGHAECQFYIKTGTCKFGPACGFHHPRPKVQSSCTASGQLQLNFLGLPLRPGEKECAYYVQTGSCKFGGMCRFHHPQPFSVEIGSPAATTSPPYAPESSIAMPPTHGPPAPTSSPFYTPPSSIAMPLMHFSASAASAPYMPPSSIAMPPTSSYQDETPSWPPSRASFMRPGPGMPRPTSFMPLSVSSPQPAGSTPQMLQQQGMPPTSEGPQAIGLTHNIYTNTQRPFNASVAGVNGPHPHQGPRFPASFLSQAPAPNFSSHGQVSFPEQLGQPDCHHYMKTGDCKFGANCKYHHPKDRAMSLPVDLNPMGLPIRPGKSSCPYYIRHRICKFGSLCKFDHPMLPES